MYKAKYLPVEGEIKEGDYYFIGLNQLQIADNSADFDPKWYKRNAKKVKLFLTSTDIQVGDKVLGTILSKEVWVVKEPEDIDQISLDEAIIMGGYKVIGEISPGAKWVKHDQTLTHGDLRANGVGVNWVGITDGNLKFKVKCPSCETFH